MSGSCVITPRLKSGEPSPLFSRLQEFLGNTREALYWWSRATSPEFSKVFPNIKLDENREPSFDDLMDKAGLKDAVDMNKAAEKLTRENKVEGITDYSTVKLVQKRATAFNRSNKNNNNRFAATMQVEGNRVSLRVVPKDNVNQEDLQRMEVNVKLNQALEGLLSEWGIGIGTLSKLEESLGLNGVTDFNVALNSAEGIKQVIRLAKGKRGARALPEEFAHFATEAVGDIPLRNRMLSVLSNEEILKRVFGEQFERYKKLYNNNLELMATEALGKLVAKALNDENVFISNKALFNRYLNELKEFFGSLEGDRIDDIINEVMSEVYEFTNNIVNKRYELKVSNIRFKTQLAQLSNDVNVREKAIESILAKEIKRLRIYGKDEKFNEAQTKLINSLKESINIHNYINGILGYCTDSLNILSQLVKRLESVDTIKDSKEKFETLRNIRNYISSYGSIFNELNKSIHEARRKGDTEYVTQLKAIIRGNLDLISQLGDDYVEIAKDSFAGFIQPFVNEKLANTIKGESKPVDAKTLIESLDKDISLLDRWIDSMADSSDTIIQIYDQIIKKQRGEARLDTEEMARQIKKATRELELAGVKDTSFMYERDEDGNLTGYFIQKIWWSKYFRAKAEFFKRIEDKYGKSPKGKDLEDRNKEVSAWYKENTITIEGEKKPREDLYSNPAFDRMLKNKAQEKYYNFIIQLKENLDALLPGKHNSMRAPQIRRGLIERVLNNPNKVGAFWESMKDILIRREDDTEYGDASTLMDFEGNEVMFLPIYYTRRLENMSDLSLDTASTMIAYASMANDYNRMNEVIDTLEVGRQLLAEREVQQHEGNKPKVEKYKRLGVTISKFLTKKGGETLFMQKLNDLMEMHAYGRMQEDEGTIPMTKIDKAKGASLLSRLTSYSTTALSLLTGVANVMQNIVTAGVETIGGRFFSAKELAYADKEYGKALPAYLAEIGNRIKTSKLALVSELFNISQDFGNTSKNVGFNKKNWLTKLMSENTLFFTTQAGDHWTQHRVAIAVLSRIKVTYQGKETNLWEVLTVTPLDKNNPKLGAKLTIPEGVKFVDGGEFSRERILSLSNQIRGIENILYGIYNSEDRIALKRKAVGRMIMQFRDWMRPLYNTRYGKGNYNYDLGVYTEGYFRTFLRYIMNVARDARKLEFTLVKNWKSLSKAEVANIYKALTEIAVYWSTYAMLALIQGLKNYNDKKKPWELRMLAYAALRLKTDMGALLPSPTMLDEGTKLFTNPIACLSTIRRLRRLIDLVNPTVIFSNKNPYDTTVKSGMYKGYDVWERNLIDILPFRPQIIKALDPDLPAKWYK